MTSVATIAFCGLFALTCAAEEPPVSSELSAERRKEVAAQMKEILDQTKIVRRRDTPVEADLVSQPVLYWDDVPRGHHYGTLWIWGAKGRPAAIIEMYTVDFAKEIERWPGNVLHSLAGEPLEGKAEFSWDWAPSHPGFVPQPLEGAPPPATTRTGRRLQMRALAKRFSAQQTWRDGRAQLRLLTTPVWQYEGDDKGLIDGGLFVFAHGGANPEVVLILEAIRDATGERWSFGCVRLGHAEMEVTFDDRKVWSVALYQDVNPHSSYYWIASP
jgi:hypothetical protein